MRRTAVWWVAAAAASLGLVSAAVFAWAAEPNFHVTATVDTTTVELGSPVKLTITLEGDLRHARIQPFEFPPECSVVAQSRATNVSIHAGRMTRSESVHVVLLPREAGTFTLGPFEVRYDGKPVRTDPIEILVKQPVLPPGSEERQRYTL